MLATCTNQISGGLSHNIAIDMSMATALSLCHQVQHILYKIYWYAGSAIAMTMKSLNDHIFDWISCLIFFSQQHNSKVFKWNEFKSFFYTYICIVI